MDNFDKFWHLLPKKDADIYFELRNYVESPGCETDISHLFKTSTHRYILSNLLEHPYPMCQIVRCFPPSIYMQLFYETLQQFVEFTPQQMLANKFNLYSFLINIHMSDKWLEKCEVHIFNVIFQQIDGKEYWELPLVLLASKSMPLIKAFNDYLNHSHDTNPYIKRNAFFMATNRNMHFFEALIQNGQDTVEPEFINGASRLIRLATLISNKPTRPNNDFNFYDEVWKQFEQINPINLSDNQKIFYYEFARMLSLHHFVRSNRRYEGISDSMAIKVLASKYNILDFFVKFNEGCMITNTSDYPFVRKQLVENRIFNQSINPHIPKDTSKPSEVNIYDQFYTIYLMIEVLLIRPMTRNYENIIRTKSAEIKQIVENIDDSRDYIESIEYLFMLLFLRFEHVKSRVFSNGRLENSSTTTSVTHESDTTIESTGNASVKKALTQSNVKNGFACTFIVVRYMLSALSSSMANRKIDKQNEALNERFERISDAIEDAKWRLQVIDSYYTATNCIRASSDLKVMLTSRCRLVYSKVFSSSDDDDKHIVVPRKGHSAIRRKPRRRNASKKPLQITKDDTVAKSTEFEGKVKDWFSFSNISITRYGNHRDRRRFMTKMLGQLTDMVAILVIRGDLTGAKNIIETHNLSDSAIANEVQLLEKFHATKNALKELIKAMPNATEDDDSLENLQNVITHEIEQFLTTVPIHESEDTKILLDRFVGNYPYLEPYIGRSLQGVVLVDYALSFPSAVDTTSILVDMLPKFWDKDESIETWQNRIGYYGFIRQILSTFSIYNAGRNDSTSIKDLLSTQLYTFNTVELTQRLHKEDTFKKQQQVELCSLNTRAGLIENIINFENYSQKNENWLQHVYTYSMNMNRLINLKNAFNIDSDRTCLQEILEIDLFSLIGDIMFDENTNITLSDIEAIVCNLNTNLIHVITKNTCPIISICDKFCSNRNDDLNEMLQLLTKDKDIATDDENDKPKTVSRKPFKIKRHDILDYVHQHNELIAYLLKKIHGLEPLESNCETQTELNCQLLDNMMQMEEISIQTESHEEGDRMLAALSFDTFNLNFARELILQGKYRWAQRLFQFSPERHFNRYKDAMQNIEDILITKILEEDKTVQNDDDDNEEATSTFTLIEHIKDLRLKSKTLLQHINRISDEELASHLIRTVLLHNRAYELPKAEIQQLQNYMSQITLFANIGRATTMTELLPCDTWTKVMEISRLEPERLLHSLIERNQFDICYEWMQAVSLQETVMKATFIDLFMSKINEHRNTNNECFIKVSEMLLKIIATQTDTDLLLKLRSRKLLQYLVDFLIENSTIKNQIYINYKITLNIFDVIDAKEVDTLWDLVEMPLLIIEQYVINSKFETLSKILQVIRPQLKSNECSVCTNATKMHKLGEHAEHHDEIKLQRGMSRNFHVINYRDHTTSIQCIDHILQIYAAKALDFRIGSGISESSTPSRTVSLESLCGTFIMPREAPDKTKWIKDLEATHCMCCKRSVFTMLTRRHHCRRCGRVVCHTCSSKRLLIPNLYDNVMVRVCDDCFKQTHEAQNMITEHFTSQTVDTSSSLIASLLEASEQPIASRSGWIYRFTGNLKHDTLQRDEFSFEYAPSASLCLTLISMHTPGQDCCDFLLSHCKTFEALLKPLKPGHANPEVDYAFVTRILYCLSFAAKVHGGTSECVEVREHAEIINSVVRNGCESLLPMESINMKSLRTLRDNLFVAEKFGLAIEISLKSGLEKTGIMAAWGIACIKAGCFETAREKFVHCLVRTTCDEDCRQILHFLTTDDQTVKNQGKIFNFKSTNRSPKIQPLLFEILAILESTCHPVSSNILQKASSISQSNRSLLSLKFGKKEKYPVHESAVNILHTLSNLKQISHGKYSVKTHRTLGLTDMENMSSLFASDSEQHGLHSRFYTESIYYLVRYGRHIDILRFLIKYKQVTKALKYSLFLLISADQFIQTIIMPYLKSGRLNVIIQQMIDMDATLMMWKDYIIQICLMLEKRNLLNSLYQVQLLLKDTIRASMTCVRFYAMGCVSYQDLRNNVYHLMNAQQHLKSELELSQWEEIKTQTKRTEENQSFVMKMDSKSLNQHINTIWLQIDASKFLASCEEHRKETVSLIPKISLQPCTRIPTLFENTQDKIVLTALILICGANIEEGFGLAYRIIQDMGLNCDKIYAIATKYLALNNRLLDVEKLVCCIKSNSNQGDVKLCDEILSLAVQSALSNHACAQRTKAAIENLIRLISDVSTQIDCHILSGQLKAAYLLAVQHKRVPDIRRILRYAEKTNQTQIKKLCEKKLQSTDAQGGHSSDH